MHQIRLNGTQLVFVLVASTVVLALPLVSRLQVGPVSAAAAPTYDSLVDTPIAPDANLARVVAPEDLAGPGPGPAPAAVPPPASAAAIPDLAPAAESRTPAPPAVVAAAPRKPDVPAMTIQVKASESRGEAEAMADQLIARGYEAYVLAPTSAAQPLFRVRVGRFRERAEAAAVVDRLTNDEKLETWLVHLTAESRRGAAPR